MKEEKKYIGRGGWRGGGRPRLDENEPRRTSMTISGTKTEIEKIKQIAKEKGVTVSRLLIEAILKQTE